MQDEVEYPSSQGCLSWLSYGVLGRLGVHTPLTTFVPTRVTNPFTFSDRNEDSTKVEPGSWGASRAAHS